MTASAARAVIVSGARTPIGKFGVSLSGYTAAELGAIAIRAALTKADLPGDSINRVIMGQVLTAGAGQLPARQAASAAGIPMSVPATNLNTVCLSGLEATAMAAQLVVTGQCDTVVAGGQESMSQAPHLLPHSRTGTKYGDTTLIDHLAHDGLLDVYTGLSMGAMTDAHNTDQTPAATRAEQEAYAAQSHQRAAIATENGVFAEEIVPTAAKPSEDMPQQSRPTRPSAPARQSRPCPDSSPRSPTTAPGQQVRPHHCQTAPPNRHERDQGQPTGLAPHRRNQRTRRSRRA